MSRDFEFRPPSPYTVVVWRQQQSDDPVPALVTARFERTISCTIFPLDYPRGVPKDGVRNIADPIAPHIDPIEGGGYWDFTEDQKMLHQAVGDPVDFVRVKK